MTREIAVGNQGGNETTLPKLQMVAWEITRSCNLLCAHCRSSSTANTYEDELSTEECLRLIDGIAEIGKPVLILTGGEPLLRQDLFPIARYAVDKGLRVVRYEGGLEARKD